MESSEETTSVSLSLSLPLSSAVRNETDSDVIVDRPTRFIMDDHREANQIVSKTTKASKTSATTATKRAKSIKMTDFLSPLTNDGRRRGIRRSTFRKELAF